MTDIGVVVSVELRFPVLHKFDNNILLQIALFIDFGYSWNDNRDNPDTNTLPGSGMRLLLNINSDLTARFDWGILLISVDFDRDTLQENGLYFSIGLSLF